MNDKWQIHKVGLVNFWYYDEEEFHFLDGRMILRGANGSGKSVTMQSFIPLLLDGNMRPERLDPFGSRARKMENYLLEDEDDREERTGYLYMEFRKKESNQYITIGIGMRARRNKKMDSWYFCITDGRRVGKEFWLYKDVQNKIPFSRTELRNRIGDGGQVMDTQNEYMQCVNRLLFGFETMEEYKEMLELLIQLRTPKLSKDFKPTVINDILSNSLQTLSEDDLRPMSEAIENMDNMKTNLDTLKDSIQAAAQIERIYSQYNQSVLYEKAVAYQNASHECRQYEKFAAELKKHLTQMEEELRAEQEKQTALKQEKEVLEEEKNSLSQSDAARLKEEEQQISSDIKEDEKQLEEKETQERRKNETRIEIEEKQKRQEEKNEQIWDEILTSLDEMEECMEEIPFDESEFFIKEMRENKGEEHSFSAHGQLLREYCEKVDNGICILEKEDRIHHIYDDALRELDECKKKRDAAERECVQYEKLLHNTKAELLEQYYQWEKENQILHISSEVMQNIARKVESYRFGDDYSEIREMIRNQRNGLEDKIREEKAAYQHILQPLIEEIDKLNAEVEEWENQREPEPERTSEVIKNREKLEQLQIPFLEFYKVVEFAENVTEEEKGRMEDALLKMGILDALVVSAEYREQVLSLDEGSCDKYIFSDVNPVSENLSAVLNIDSEQNNIILYQQISTALFGIGFEKQESLQSGTWLDREGRYRLGVLEGNTCQGCQSRYIGAAARERFKQEKLTELRCILEEKEVERQRMEQCMQDMDEKKKQMETEWEKQPKEEDLKVAAKQYAEKESDVTAIQREIRTKENDLEIKRKNLEEVRLQVQEICARTYLSIRLEVFHAAKENLGEYAECFQKVKENYSSYRNGMEMVSNFNESLQNAEEDLDDIRYEKGRIVNRKRKLEVKLLSVQEQLRLTDYEEIRERLDYCLNRLAKLPDEIETATTNIANLKKELDYKKTEQENNAFAFAKGQKKEQQLEMIFLAEFKLFYVETGLSAEEVPKQLAEKVISLLRGTVEGKNSEELHGKVQAVFHEQKCYLVEYQMMIRTLFEEEREKYREIGARISRLDIRAKYRGQAIPFHELLQKLEADREEQERLLSDKDRELFEDILANTISKKIRARIHSSKRWVDNMNRLMESMQTSSGLRLSLRWKSKRAETEEQMDTKSLVELLQKDVEIMREEDVDKLSSHFRSKIAEARKQAEDTMGFQSFHTIMKEILDYRQWFEFQLECQKTGEKKRELTDRIFFTFSGGEKAMAMYVPLFSAVVAKYGSAGNEAPRLISLDEAFAGVDEMNIKDMFRLMVEFEFNFMINSQILWGDYETVPSVAIYQLVRPENAKYVTVIPYVWNGKSSLQIKSQG
jgi:uncharacterized protein (TIGR02680 family)